jgi:hypothetical protein
MEKKVGQSGRDRLVGLDCNTTRTAEQKEERTRSQAATGVQKLVETRRTRRERRKQNRKPKSGGCLALKKVDSC